MNEYNETVFLVQLTHGKVEIHKIEGNHISILGDKITAAAINGEPLEDAETFKETLNFASSELELHGKNESFMGLS